MIFTVWKVKHGVEDGTNWFSYSLRHGARGIPVILNHDQFTNLFTRVDLEDIPEAPNTITMKIETTILPE